MLNTISKAYFLLAIDMAYADTSKAMRDQGVALMSGLLVLGGLMGVIGNTATGTPLLHPHLPIAFMLTGASIGGVLSWVAHYHGRTHLGGPETDLHVPVLTAMWFQVLPGFMLLALGTSTLIAFFSPNGWQASTFVSLMAMYYLIKAMTSGLVVHFRKIEKPHDYNTLPRNH